MELKIVDIGTAKLAKEVGFDWLCRPAYLHDNGEYFPEPELREYKYEQNHNYREHRFSAPTQELLRQFLRDEHEIHISIGIELMPEMKPKLRGYSVEIHVMENASLIKSNEVSGAPINASYEEALEAGLKEALKYLLNRKE